MPGSISGSWPVTPRSAPPYCTYVGTSVARTRMTRTSAWLVARISLREVSGSSSTRTPASASSGRLSSKMRPLDSASVITSCPTQAFDVRAQTGQLGFHPVVAAVQVVDAVHQRLAVGHEAGDDQA